MCILLKLVKYYRKHELNSDFFYFSNMDISVNINYFNLKFPVYNQNILLEGSVSHNFDLGPSFLFMSKNGSLHLNLKNTCLKFEKCMCDNG